MATGGAFCMAQQVMSPGFASWFPHYCANWKTRLKTKEGLGLDPTERDVILSRELNRS